MNTGSLLDTLFSCQLEYTEIADRLWTLKFENNSDKIDRAVHVVHSLKETNVLLEISVEKLFRAAAAHFS